MSLVKTSKPDGWKRTLPVRIDTGGRLRQQRVRTKTTCEDDACPNDACASGPGVVIRYGQYALNIPDASFVSMTKTAFGAEA
jgi:hypothetical protein